MPQLDFLILTSQSIFLLIFVIGFVFFTKSILTLISFEMKMKELIELHYLYWFDINQFKLIQGDSISLSLFTNVGSIFSFLNKFSQTRVLFFGFLYGYNLLYLRSMYRRKTADRIF